MTVLAELHPCVANHHFLSQQQEDGSLAFSHQLVAGKVTTAPLQMGKQLSIVFESIG